MQRDTKLSHLCAMTPPTKADPMSPESFEPRESEHPALHPSITNVPVTPGVHLTGKSAYFDPSETEGDNQLPFDPDKASPGPSWSANSYFADKQVADKAAGTPTATEAAVDAKPEDEPLQKLNIIPDAETKHDLADVDPRAAHPKLSLSGRIISATFAIPYNVGYSKGNDWELEPRRGTSALFDSFSYLASSSSPWNHTLVGWTGEISAAKTAASPAVQPPINKAAAPIPVDPKQPAPVPQQPLGLRIGREDRERLEKQLERDHGGKIVPVWLVDEVDEGKDEYALKDQSRWRTFAEHELYTLFHYKQN
jgi:trehalose 6-phosphate synthase/phosphatase